MQIGFLTVKSSMETSNRGQRFGYFCIVLIILELLDTTLGFNCMGRSDGIYNAGCQSYTRCTGGQNKIVECKHPLVVNAETGECANPFHVKTPCGTFRDCSYLDDGNYPDLEFNCHWYYRCANGIFNGHNHCPDGLVLNSKLQVCDFARNVEPPCGTKTN